MPMNLDAVGAVSKPSRTSWTSKDALLYALGVGAGQTDPTGFELEFTTENSHGRRAARAADDAGRARDGRRSGPAELGRVRLPHAAARRAGRDGARPDPARRRGRVGRARSSASTTRARPRSCGSRRSRRTSTAASPRSTTRFAAFIRGEGGFGESRGDEIADPPKMPDRSARPRGDVRDARRPGVALPPVAATATRCTPTRRSRSSRASTGRSCTASAPTASPAARCCTSCAAPTSRKFESMDARFSKPVFPGDTLTVRMWDDGRAARSSRP